MNPIDAVLEGWRLEGVLLNAPAAPVEIARLQQVVGAALPRDVQYYFSKANGMSEGKAADDSLTNLWPIQKILSDPWRRSGRDARGDFTDLGFADVMINSWFVCFRVRPARGMTIHVEAALLELPSLTEFFRLYLEDRKTLCL